MSVKWEQLEGSKGKLTFTVPAKQFDKALDQAFKKVVKDIAAPGFRKGKMPRALFERQYGVESLYNDALDFVLPEAYPAALDEAGIDPVAPPARAIPRSGKGEDLIIVAEVAVKPEVTLGDYKGLEVERVEAKVTDEDVEKQLATQLEQHAEMVVKADDAAVENGDTVTIDFEGFANGEAFEGGKAEQYPLEVGSGSFIPGFEEQLVGMKTGEEKEVEVTFPEEYHAAELAGQPATFKVTVHDIKVKQIPELDDELAQDIDPTIETVAELKAKMKENLEENNKAQADGAVQSILIKKAADNAEMDVPAEMVENQIDSMIQNLEQSIQGQGMTMDLYYQFSGQDENTLRESMKEEAEATVRQSLVLEAIAEEEKIEATEEEVNEELAKMGAQFGMEAEQIKEILQGTERIEDDLKMRKTVDFLVENADVKEA